MRRLRIIQSILLLAGSFTFAFLLGEMVHETGHYLAHLAFNNLDARVHLDPFGGSRIEGVATLPEDVMGITAAAGPLFNLILGLVCFFLLFRKQTPALFPLLLWGPVALVQEGVTFSLGFLTPGGDAQWVASLGIPEFFLFVSGLTLILAGLGAIAWLLDLTGIAHLDSFWDKYFIVAVGMCSLMLIRFIYSAQAYPNSIQENFVPLVLSLLLGVIVVLLHKPVTRIAGKISLLVSPIVTWTDSIQALTLGLVVFVFQIVALN